VVAVLSEGDDDRAEQVRSYERAHALDLVAEPDRGVAERGKAP
jgi:hypothetical protein